MDKEFIIVIKQDEDGIDNPYEKLQIHEYHIHRMVVTGFFTIFNYNKASR
jgi:hypothetical protein